MTYRHAAGTVEIDLTGRRDYYPAPRPVYGPPQTPAERAAGLVVATLFLGAVVTVFLLAPRGAVYYEPAPALRIRVNRRKRRRTSRKR
jgi:hypothetical protein